MQKSWYGKLLIALLLAAMSFCAIFYFLHRFSLLEMCCTTTEGVQDLKNLILGTGNALIASVAIIAPLMLFVMQVNIERMPHGLFRRLSRDIQLLLAFVLAFLLAIGLSVLSIFINHGQADLIVSLAFSFIVLVLYLIVSAYWRVLYLIDPQERLEEFVQDARDELEDWAQCAHKKTPQKKQEKMQEDLLDNVEKYISHAMSFAQYYAGRKDYEISKKALDAVADINVICISACIGGKDSVFLNGFSREHPVKKTLKRLKKYAQTAIACRDEEQIVQALETAARIVCVHIKENGSRFFGWCHAHEVAIYLADIVRKTPHDMIDALLRGQQLMGECARCSIVLGHGYDMAAEYLSKEIVSLAHVDCTENDRRPMVEEGLRQLATLTYDLLCFEGSKTEGSKTTTELTSISTHQDAILIMEKTLKKTGWVAQFFGNEPYYDALQPKLEELAHSMCSKKPLLLGEKEIRKELVIRNIEQWASDLCRTEEKLLLKAMEKNHGFAERIIYWIVEVIKILLVVANAPACNEENKKKLRQHARSLISAFGQTPGGMELLSNDQLIKGVADIHRDHKHIKIIKEIGDDLLLLMFNDMFKNEIFWLLKQAENSLLILAVLALAGGDEEVSRLKAAIKNCLSGEDAPEQNIRDRAAEKIRERASSIPEHIFTLIKQADSKKLRHLLEEIANLLQPELINTTAG